MKKLKERKLNNNGFSLVELIIVIAIMAVLVGVLSPQFIKYVEQSRRATDIQNAQSIQTAILADIADGAIKEDIKELTVFDGDKAKADAISTSEIPTVQGNVVSSSSTKYFYVKYSVSDGTCNVYPANDDTYDLTTSDGASGYKGADTGEITVSEKK
jgi:type IV pilus assembly protein PilA